MSLTRSEWEVIWVRLRKIEEVNKKVWKARHYKWANDINYEVKQIKEKVQQVIGQME